MQKKFLKWLLGINKYCTNNACRASTGRFPMKINAQCRNFKFWLSLINRDLALINWAGGLYERILTEVASTDRTQWGLYQRRRSRFSHTDRPSSVNKMFIIMAKQESKGTKTSIISSSLLIASLARLEFANVCSFSLPVS